MNHIGIRDLQKMSGEAITALPGPTPVKSGDRTVAILIPLKPANMEKLKEALDLADELAKGRDPKEDDAALIAEGIDPTNYDEETVRKLMEEGRRMRW